jgi:hypothetical protein
LVSSPFGPSSPARCSVELGTSSLQKLPQLHTAITENRKSRNPLVLGFQGKAQLEVIYGHLAEVMLSQPATKIFLRTTEPNAAEWVIREFLSRIGANDRVLLIGDIRQHQGVEAGRPFEQLQEAGMRTARLDEIVRQQDPALKSAEKCWRRAKCPLRSTRSNSRVV